MLRNRNSANSLKAKENSGRQLTRKKNDEIVDTAIMAEMASSGQNNDVPSDEITDS